MNVRHIRMWDIFRAILPARKRVQNFCGNLKRPVLYCHF